MRPLSVLQTCFSRSWGGLEMQALEMSASLAARGHRVTLAALPDSRLLAAARTRGISVAPFAMRGYLHPLLTSRLARAMKHLSVDIVHAQHSRDIATVVPAAILSGGRRPVVLSKRVGSRLMKRDPLHRFTYGRLSRILAVSSVIRKNVIETTPVGPELVTVLHDAVDTKRFNPATVDAHAFRRSLGIADDALVVGSLGRFSPGKGHEDLLHAAGVIRDSSPDVRFVVVGEASFGEESYERSVRELAKRLGVEDTVVFAGFRSNVPEVMASFDVFAFPSHAEAFGMALIEAMAMQKPVVACSCDGVLDIVQQGVNGLLVPPMNPLALSLALKRLVDNPGLRTRLGQAARERVVTHFDQERQTDALEAVYAALVKSRPATSPR
jgi:glycosyltransferase involved in cell wall biosynthesis